MTDLATWGRIRRISVAALAALTAVGCLVGAISHVVDVDRGLHCALAEAETPSACAYITLAGWIAVIAVEFAIAAVMLTAAPLWVRSLAADRATAGPGMAERMTDFGWGVAILLSAFGFLTVGNEWPLRWIWPEWAGSRAPLHIFLVAATGLVLSQLSDNGIGLCGRRGPRQSPQRNGSERERDHGENHHQPDDRQR